MWMKPLSQSGRRQRPQQSKEHETIGCATVFMLALTCAEAPLRRMRGCTLTPGKRRMLEKGPDVSRLPAVRG